MMAQLTPFIIRLILLFPLLLPVCMTAPAQSMTILRDQSKSRVEARKSGQQNRIRTLGRYANIDSIKQRARSSRGIGAAFRPQAISAKSIIVMDAVSGKTLFSRAPDTPRQPASTIKVLTAMIAIDMLGNRQHVTVSKKAARQPRSKIYLDTRKTYLAGDLINAVLLASANDASVALAEKIAGSEKSFAAMMTRQARRFGANNTICKTASGLTAAGQKTTARDLATIFRLAMKNKEFAARMKKTKIHTADGTLLRNHNKALWQIDGALAGKTGYTSAARQTYVGKFKRGTDEIIVAIMGSETMWTDIKKLVSYGFSTKERAAALASQGSSSNS